MKITRQILADKIADYLLGSARDSRAGDGALAIANFSKPLKSVRRCSISQQSTLNPQPLS